MTHPALREVSFQAAYPVPGDVPPAIIRDPMQPLVSIVTPSYNQGGFIRETIESVLNQDYPNIEYWVIDGGSTDGTLSILQEYEHDPRFHWVSEKDQGQSDAINKGLARCRGEIFNWLGSDDLLLPGALRHVADAWRLFPQPCVIYGWARLIDQEGHDLGYCPLQSSLLTLEQMLRLHSLPSQQSTFVPTRTLRAVGGVDPSFHFVMDVDLWIRLIQKIPFRHIPVDLALYRLHGASKSVSLSVRFIGDVTEILNRAAQKGFLSQRQANGCAHLYAARVYLTPEGWKPRMALDRLVKAVRDDPSTLPLASYILLKGVARAVLGERNWARVRFLQLKVH